MPDLFLQLTDDSRDESAEIPDLSDEEAVAILTDGDRELLANLERELKK